MFPRKAFFLYICREQTQILLPGLQTSKKLLLQIYTKFPCVSVHLFFLKQKQELFPDVPFQRAKGKREHPDVVSSLH